MINQSASEPELAFNREARIQLAAKAHIGRWTNARTHKGRPSDCCLRSFRLSDAFHRPSRPDYLPQPASFAQPLGRSLRVCQVLQYNDDMNRCTEKRKNENRRNYNHVHRPVV